MCKLLGVTNSFLALPQVETTQAINAGVAYERDAYITSLDKTAYEGRVMTRVNELFKKRQANEQNIHNSLAAQSQAQMMMNPSMQMRGMGQPLQPGFQNFQQQMQSSPINQQGQPNIGVNTPNGLPMNSNQHMMPMGGQMRPQMAVQLGLANLSPQDRMKLSSIAFTKMSSMSEQSRNQFRAMLQTKFSPQLLAQLQQERMDPLIYYFQTQMLSAAKTQATMGQTGMQMQPQQRPMNQPSQHLPTGPNGEYGGPFANVESIINQQKAGLMAQEAGQMVVPASNGAGPSVAPQAIGSLPGPGQAAGQADLSHQLPQQFNHQPGQQLKMDQRTADQKAAQSQAQIRAQAQAKQMQGQPGGLNGLGGVSQSPAMNTLNAPVRRTPMNMNPTEGHPQMGQGNMPFGQQIMDPRFTQAGQRAPMGPNAANMNKILHTIASQMPADTRQQIMSMPPDKIPELIMRWNATRGAGQTVGRPQPQMGQLGPGNPIAQPMGQFTPGNNNLGHHPNLNVPMNQQSQLMMAQHMNKLRNPSTPQGPVNQNSMMDNMSVHPKVLEQLRLTSTQGIPAEVKRWGQLKQWVLRGNFPQQTIDRLLSIQAAQFQSALKNNPAFAPAATQPPQSNPPQQGIHPNGQPGPQMVQTMPNLAGPNLNITVTPQEIQNARAHERFKNLSEEELRQVIMRMKIQAMRNRTINQQPGTPAQVSQAPPTGQNTITPTPQAVNGTTAPQKQQNQGPETNTSGPAAQGRNIKQPPNRAMPNVAAASTAKTGTKRPMPDDAAEGPNLSGTPIQRPHPQPPQAGASSTAPQLPQLSPDQIAAMTPDQRQKYDMMVKSRQPAQNNQLSNEMMRLKAIGQEQHQLAIKEQLPDIPMTADQCRDTAQRIQAMSNEMNKIRRALVAWYTVTNDDARARLFFKLRNRLIKQFVDGEKMSIIKEKFSITSTDLDNIKSLLESMTKDVATHFPQIRKNPSQQNPLESAQSQGASARPGAPTAQTAPLSAANLEKQTQALSRIHQRNNSRAGQPPAAPTTAQPPFPFGVQSPDGQPTYAGKPPLTQENLHLPARKKHKPEPKPGTGSGQNGSSANASPQVPKLPSPEMTKRQAAVETRQTPAKPQFLCTDQYCDFRSIGFSTEDILRKHIDEEHTKPAEDPLKFAQEGLAEVLGLDVTGKAKKVAATGGTGQSPNMKAETVNSREVPMKRQGSATDSKPNELIKTIVGKAGTPKSNPGLKVMDGASTTAIIHHGGMALQATGGESMGTTIDPQELLSTITGLEMGGGGAILDMGVYRALTPNDTPESIKDSATSEPNSDVSEGVTLNVTLDMGLDSWDPFTSGGHELPHADQGNVGDMSGLPYPGLTWDEFNPDFDKPFTLDTSFFSLDTS
ncbi:putative C2H2 type zinc finger domain [Rosellinia necatrix]|uniref:Putative C2H2 type zinc finger domain n=1 Tax=Rosellinia necatrix TaxID=77044 RepID=A0A1W2TH34_ROSNE|nr:putative C2H2 type zinc finger domain [Rosellinia necatrix]